jgi:hypothetical protein
MNHAKIFWHCVKMFAATLASAGGFYQTAWGAGNHQLSLETQGAIFQTAYESDSVSVMSALGAQAGYAYRMGLGLSLFARYQLIYSGFDTLLLGSTVGADYAIMGGQTLVTQVPGDSIVEYAFPYRWGISVGFAERSYNLSELKEGAVSFDDAVPLKGELMGVELGTSVEVALSSWLSATARVTYLAPAFRDTPKQTGLIIGFGAGLAVLL